MGLNRPDEFLTLLSTKAFEISNFMNLSIDPIFSVPERPLHTLSLYVPAFNKLGGTDATNLYLPIFKSKGDAMRCPSWINLISSLEKISNDMSIADFTNLQ